MEGDKPTTVLCTVFCNFNNYSVTTSSKRLFRLLISIATDTKVKVVICFDRADRVLFGCSADDFLHFVCIHPFAAMTASKIPQ
ncbi:Nucleic acid-binding, OB-fold containing protein [Melia azedarach]|uniref:Nucleic acid-binding, OB-fold containing protein n=1 Tax=Melia azedarach TaxID=155640 RepID=A0ACC1YNC1_MELAZ|nr:Nucleic acid-binding, OB-fold containing protein [Melia azedarach]